MTFNKFGMLISFVASILWSSGVAEAQSVAQAELTPAPDAANKAASASLETFEALVTPENAKTYGFDFPGAVASAQVGPPVHEAFIGLDSLKSWKGEDVDGLIKSTGRLIYPIISKEGTARSSVTLQLKDGEWVPVSFGDVRNTQIRSEIRNQIDKNVPPGGEQPQLLQVRVPALNLNFLAQRKDDDLLFTSMQSVPSIEIKEGTTEPAKDMLTRVQTIAVKVSSDVPN
jgi:hypothetical protein